MSSFDDDVREQKRQEMEYRKMMLGVQQLSQSNGLLNAALSQNVGGLISAGGYGLGQFQQEIKKPLPFGNLYLNGKPLPVEWRGAEYDRFERTAGLNHWELRFLSKWSIDTILVHLDIEKHSGAEVLKMAETFLEVINQRRLG